MKLKFRNLAIATTAIVGLTACNNSENLPVNVAKNADVSVSVNIPSNGVATRGVIQDASNQKIEVKNIQAFIKKGTSVIKNVLVEDDMIEGKTTYTIPFGSVMVDGTENVEVVINANPEKNEISVDDIQPSNTNSGLENVVYLAKSNSLGSKDSQGNYDVTGLTANPIAARLEVTGSAKFNEDLVKSMEISYVSPTEYTLNYGKSETLNKVSDATLAYSGSDITTINGGKKVVANHLFAGDVTKVVVGFDIVKYKCPTDNAGRYIMVSAGNDKFYPIYTLGDNTYVYKKDNNYYDVKIKLQGDQKPILTLGDMKNDVNLLTHPVKTEYFMLNGFDTASKGVYEAGNIYKINLTTGMKWNVAGSGFEDAYTPDINGGSEDKDNTNEKKEANVNVSVDVLKWTVKDTSVSVN